MICEKDFDRGRRSVEEKKHAHDDGLQPNCPSQPRGSDTEKARHQASNQSIIHPSPASLSPHGRSFFVSRLLDRLAAGWLMGPFGMGWALGWWNHGEVGWWLDHVWTGGWIGGWMMCYSGSGLSKGGGERRRREA